MGQVSPVDFLVAAGVGFRLLDFGGAAFEESSEPFFGLRGALRDGRNRPLRVMKPRGPGCSIRGSKQRISE